MSKSLSQQMSQGDLFSVLAELTSLPDRVAAARQFDTLLRDLYWQERNLPSAIGLACAGIQYCLSTAAASPQLEEAILGWAKTLAYNLASFTWRGWNEPGIVIRPQDERLGLSAAQLNLRLAQTLQKGDLPLSRAEWLVGAHWMAQGNWARAEEHFRLAAGFAETAEAEADLVLVEGYLAMLPRLSGDANQDQVQLSLAAAEQRLLKVEHGPALVEQLRTAVTVFAGS